MRREYSIELYFPNCFFSILFFLKDGHEVSIHSLWCTWDDTKECYTEGCLKGILVLSTSFKHIDV